MERPKVPLANIICGDFIYWLSIIAAIICMIGPVIVVAFMDNNVLNPHYLFATLWEGKRPEAVWQEVGGGFPGGHFWLNNLTFGDGFTQLGLAIGSGSGLLALVATAIAYLREKPRAYGWALVSLFISLVILFAALGIVKLVE